MPLARNSIYEFGTQILVSHTWDKSPNRIRTMQHVAREGGLFVISTYMALKTDDIPDNYSFKNFILKEENRLILVIVLNGKIIARPLEVEKGILYADTNLPDMIKAKRMFDAFGHYSRPDVFNFNVNQPNKN